MSEDIMEGVEVKAEDVKYLGKKIFYLYQRVFWYVAQAKNEMLKPLGFWNETILVLTFLTVSGQKIPVHVILIGYVVLIGVLAVVGKIIVMMGIVKYNTKIANHQNDELMEIITKLDTLIANQKHE